MVPPSLWPIKRMRRRSASSIASASHRARRARHPLPDGAGTRQATFHPRDAAWNGRIPLANTRAHGTSNTRAHGTSFGCIAKRANPSIARWSRALHEEIQRWAHLCARDESSDIQCGSDKAIYPVPRTGSNRCLSFYRLHHVRMFNSA